jgi:CHAT domain-containing protein
MDAFDSAELEKLPRLPDTAEEVRSIALAMNADLTRDVFVGKAANEAQVKNMDLFGYRVIAFATHGLVPGDLNGLTQPALALSAPDVAGVAGDGLLTMGEILGLKLDADWVVLSACNTAAAQGAGAEAISGLGRAFFYAGARALLVSNWPVETTSAKLLTTDIFRQQARTPSLSRAGALRQAMLNLVDGPGYVDGKGRTVFSYAHPIFWAPFSLIGDGGGSAPGA